MAKQFDPLEYNYELVEESKEDKVFHFQKILVKKDRVFTDIIELSFWAKQNIWILFIEIDNLKQFLPAGTEMVHDSGLRVTLFVGEIKNEFDWLLITKRILKDPHVLIQLGS